MKLITLSTMPSLEAKIEFDDAINEIRLLINYSKRNKNDRSRYAAFNKASIILLCAKFEAFIESFLEEYCFLHLNNSSNHNLDLDISEHITDILLENLIELKSNKIKRKQPLKILTELYGEKEIKPCNSYKINAKFKYGKHGQNEVERLLNTFGFKTYSQSQEVQLFLSKFNSLNNIRNNIIHEDATPSLTHQDVENYLSDIELFISNLDLEAQNKIKIGLNLNY